MRKTVKIVVKVYKTDKNGGCCDLLYRLWLKYPLAYYKAGQFIATEGWQHKDMYLHGDCELMIGLEREVHLQIGTDEIILRRGEAVFIPPGVLYHGTKPSEANASFYWLHFFPAHSVVKEQLADFQERILNLRESDGEFAFLPQKFALGHLERVIIMIRQIMDIAQSNYYSNNCIDYLTSALVLEVAQQYRDYLIQHGSQSETKRMDDIGNWIRVNIYEDLTVETVSDHFGLNPDYLTRLMKKHYGMSTIQYLNHWKMNEVKHLLTTTDLTIREIAYQLEFNSEKYLMRMFKNTEQMTPTQYRNTYAKNYINTYKVDPDQPLTQKGG